MVDLVQHVKPSESQFLKGNIKHVLESTIKPSNLC